MTEAEQLKDEEMIITHVGEKVVVNAHNSSSSSSASSATSPSLNGKRGFLGVVLGAGVEVVVGKSREAELLGEKGKKKTEEQENEANPKENESSKLSQAAPVSGCSASPRSSKTYSALNSALESTQPLTYLEYGP